MLVLSANLTGLGRSSIVKIVRLFEILVVHFIPKLAKIRTFNLFYEGIRFVLPIVGDRLIQILLKTIRLIRKKHKGRRVLPAFATVRFMLPHAPQSSFFLHFLYYLTSLSILYE